jgi:hypothetical protein
LAQYDRILVYRWRIQVRTNQERDLLCDQFARIGPCGSQKCEDDVVSSRTDAESAPGKAESWAPNRRISAVTS